MRVFSYSGIHILSCYRASGGDLRVFSCAVLTGYDRTVKTLFSKSLTEFEAAVFQRSGETSEMVCERPIAIAFHAERLYDDRTWQHMEKVAQELADRSSRATFFVYPFRARLARKDITHRVRALAAMGHEIGQHTHFYAGKKTEKGDKADDLSDENVVHCLTRDFENLASMGHTPKGFSAGGWVITPILYEILLKLEFTYDCSARFPIAANQAMLPHNRWLKTPEYYGSDRGRILCLPTTCSAGEWLKWGRKVMPDDDSNPRIIYMHDYDLLTFHRRWLCRRVMLSRGRHELQAVRSIAAQYRIQRG